jgi:hypothetical protein
MIGVWGDVTGGIQVRAANVTTPWVWEGLDRNGNKTSAIEEDGTYKFGAGATHASLDLGLKRASAGVLEINNGTAGTYGDLNLRNLLASGNATSTNFTALGIITAPYYTATSSTASQLPYASSTAITVSGTASTSALVASNSFTFSNVTGFLKAVAGAVSTALINLASDVTGILSVGNGGTGQTSFTAGSLIYGAGSGALQSVATSSLSLGLGLSYSGTLGAFVGGAAGSLTVSTSSLFTGTAGQVDYYSGTGSLVGTSTLFVSTAGNVGIGTTTPWGRFSITGSGAGATNDFVFADSNNVPKLVIQDNGKVGIGTSTPWGKLSIADSSDSNNHFSVKSFAGGDWSFGSYYGTDARALITNSAYAAFGSTYTANNGDGGLRLGQTGAYSYIVGGTNLLLNPVSGKVGIATTTPWRTLSVTGTVGLDGLGAITGTNSSLCLDSNKQVVYSSDSDSCASSLRATKHAIQNLDLDALAKVIALQPVSFIYNNDASSTVRYGFIAEDTTVVDTHLATYDQTGAISGIDDRSIISIVVKAIQQLATTVAGFADNFVSAHITAVTGDFDQVNTKKLCVGDTCVTPAQFQAMVAAANQSTAGASSSSNTASTTTDTPPVITINGNNPAVVHVGDTYSDLGATITAPEQDKNLGLKTFLNGTLASTIDYVATDQSGLTSTSTRTVIVSAPETSNAASTATVLDNSLTSLSPGSATSSPNATTIASSTAQ